MPVEQDEIWTTGHGRAIAVGDLHETHMRNIIRKMIRDKREKELLLDIMIERNPEFMAQFQSLLESVQKYEEDIKRSLG